MGDTVYHSDGTAVSAVTVTGAKRWFFRSPTYRLITGASRTPAVGYGLVYADQVDGVIYALDALSGAERWRFTFSTSDQIRATEPALVAGKLYFGTTDGKLYALNAATGEELWVFNLGSSNGIRSLTVVDDVIYVGSTAGSLLAISA